METIEFFVPGIAKTAGSKRAFVNKKTGKMIVTHDNPKTKIWMDSVKWFASKVADRMCLVNEAVSLCLIFYRDRPKGHYGSGRNANSLKSSAPKNPITKPDSLKLGRAVEDALTGIILKDDSIVCHHDIKKVYCENGQKPGVKIIIRPLQNQTHPGLLPKESPQSEKSIF